MADHSYQVLARKWRPQRFDQVVGQPAIVRTLRNALEQQRGSVLIGQTQLPTLVSEREGSPVFHRELIRRKVLRREFQRFVEVTLELARRAPGRGEDEIERDVCKAGFSSRGEGSAPLLRLVPTPQPPEHFVVE